MDTQLEIGHNYGGVFNLDASKGQTMVYMGNDKWLGTNGGKTMEVVSAAQSARVVAYISRKIHMAG